MFPVNCVKFLRTTLFYNSSGVCFCVSKMKVLELVEASTRGVLWKKAFLEILQNSQENTCARAPFLKRGLWHRCFPVNFVKFLKMPFSIEHLWWMLLLILKLSSLKHRSRHRTSYKKELFLKISHNSQETPVQSLFFNKVARLVYSDRRKDENTARKTCTK